MTQPTFNPDGKFSVYIVDLDFVTKPWSAKHYIRYGSAMNALTDAYADEGTLQAMIVDVGTGDPVHIGPKMYDRLNRGGK